MNIKDAKETVDSLNSKRGWKYSIGDPIMYGPGFLPFVGDDLSSFTIVNADKTKAVWINTRGVPEDIPLKRLDESLQIKFDELFDADNDFAHNLEKTLELFDEIAEKAIL